MKRAEGKATIDYAFHVIIRELSEQAAHDMDKLTRNEGVTSFKLFMAYPGVLKAPGPPPQEGTYPPWNYSLSTTESTATATVQRQPAGSRSGQQVEHRQYAARRQPAAVVR